MIKRALKTIGIILLCIVGLFVLLFVVGYIVDIFNSAPLNAMAKKARADLVSYKADIKENAWVDYLQAMEKVPDITISFDVNNYLQGKTVLSPQFPREIEKYPVVYPIIARGNEKALCRVPFNYNAGWNMELPNYISVQKVAKILAVQSMQALKSNNMEKSVDYTIQGLKFCDHFIQGGPVLINYMVGIVSYGIMLKHLAYGLENSKYTVRQLGRIRTTLFNCADSLPLLSWALKGDIDILKSGKFPFNSLGIRLSCWSCFFSPKLAFLKGLNTQKKSIAEMSRHEMASMQITNDETTEGYPFIKDSLPGKDPRNNPIRALAEAHFSSMLKRKIELTAKLRAMNLAAEIREKELLAGGLPETLDGLDNENRINPMTRKEWNYSYTVDSVVISSSPPDSHKPTPVVHLTLKKVR